MTPIELDDLIVDADRFIAENGRLEEARHEVAELRDKDKNFPLAAEVQQEKVLGPLEKYFRRIEDATDRDSDVETVRKKIAGKLADAYGTMAGLQRKLGQRELSLVLYSAGAQLERDRRNRIFIAYNLTNKINVTLLLHPDRISDPGLMAEVRETMTRLRRGVDTPGPSDFWAVADCALLARLAGESELADDYYARLSTLAGVDGWKYHSVADVLTSLGTALEPFEPALAARLRSEADWLSKKS